MSKVTYIWTEGFVGTRLGPEIPEEGDRATPYSERYWSQVETLSLPRLKEIQLEKLQFLLRFAYEHSPFYRRKWEAAKVKPTDLKDLADLRKFPIITKEDVQQDQAEHPPYGTTPTSPPHTQMKYWQTSGTTSKPRLWTETKQDWEHGILQYSRSLYAHGVRAGWRAFYAFPYPPFSGFWLSHYASEAIGCQNVPKGPIPTHPWLQMMRNLAGTAPSILCSTPTYAIRQAEAAHAAGLDLQALKINILSMAGEPGATVPATKRWLEEHWGAAIHDILGATETLGPILFTCEAQSKLEAPSDHLNADYHLVEVLDPHTHEPLPPGQRGVACVTPLSKFGMPSIRFLLGDYLTLLEDPACACGRTLPLAQGGVSARADDMLIIKGVNIYPALIEEIVRTLPGLSLEYQIRKTRLGATVVAEALPELGQTDYAPLAKRLQQELKARTTVTLEIELKEPGSLPRGEAKTKRLVAE